MKGILSVLILVVISSYYSKAQVSPMGKKLDEVQLAIPSSSTTVSDASADGGVAIMRPASSGGGTLWYGPYTQLQGGNYIVQVRLKVASNSSNSFLFNLDAYSLPSNSVFGGLSIQPNMFRNSNEWQLFSFPVQIPNNISQIEFRGLNFNPGVTDVYLDYINIIPGDARGFYSPQFTITGAGNVGIGNQSPDAQLAVTGTVHASSVLVDQNVPHPDYVFDKNYDLATLKDVKTYIDQNHHLPEIPSAAEVAKEGINLGEMNAMLLKKIEELTLYLIEKDTESETQKRINIGLQDQIGQLKQQVIALSTIIKQNR